MEEARRARAAAGECGAVATRRGANSVGARQKTQITGAIIVILWVLEFV